MENRLRWYWRNPSDLPVVAMDETYVKVKWPLGVSVPGRRDTRGRTVDFYLSSRRNRRLHTGFGNPQQREEVARSRDSSTRKAPAMVAALCSAHAKAGAARAEH